MSSWLIGTIRGKPASEYDHTTSDSHDPWDATADIVATVEAASAVREVTVWNSHVYAYIKGEWDDGESVFESVEHAFRDGALLFANDTTDAGECRYYPSPRYHSHEYAESINGQIGMRAAAVISATHGILVRDPFHHVGRLDDSYMEDGRVFEDGKVVVNAE